MLHVSHARHIATLIPRMTHPPLVSHARRMPRCWPCNRNQRGGQHGHYCKPTPGPNTKHHAGGVPVLNATSGFLMRYSAQCTPKIAELQSSNLHPLHFAIVTRCSSSPDPECECDSVSTIPMASSHVHRPDPECDHDSVRTKHAGVNEGGICAGVGILDMPLLI